MKYTIPAVIFAGGKSSRMGTDKALLPFGDMPSLSQYQYERLKTFFEDVYLSAKSDKFDFECKIIKDRYEIHSPLAALVSIFETLETDSVFILSVDAPFVDKNVIDILIRNDEEGCDIVAAKSPSGTEPLCALYKRSILDKATLQMHKDNHRLTDLLQSVHLKEIFFENTRPFTNLNDPDEYKRALSHLV